MELLFNIYGPLAFAHFVPQAMFAHLYAKRQEKRRPLITHKYPSLSIVIPVYNEDPTLLGDCIKKAVEATYKGPKRIYVIDDGSKNIKNLVLVYQRAEELFGNKVKIILNKENKGKRLIHKQAFDLIDTDIIVTIDSDTLISENGLVEIVDDFIRDYKVGAVSGYVGVENKEKNFLTRLISYRYWLAFNQERAAQSYWSCVTCCSGPFSAYRNRVIQRVKEKYATQRFLGHDCTFGDDRHLTNLILNTGMKVLYNNRAIAYTHAPENLISYAKQQIRWNKSFYREILWNTKSIFKQSWYMSYDVLMQFITLILLFGAITHEVIIVTRNPIHLVNFALVIAVVALIRALYGLYRTHDLGFLTFLAYGFIYVFMLVPLKAVSLATLGKNGWGTR